MQACLNRTGLCKGHSTVVDGITQHKSPLFKRGRNVVMEAILPYFGVRPFCIVVSSLLWNWRSWVQILKPELTQHSALQYPHLELLMEDLETLSKNTPPNWNFSWRTSNFINNTPAPRTGTSSDLLCVGDWSVQTNRCIPHLVDYCLGVEYLVPNNCPKMFYSFTVVQGHYLPQQQGRFAIFILHLLLLALGYHLGLCCLYFHGLRLFLVTSKWNVCVLAYLGMKLVKI